MRVEADETPGKHWGSAARDREGGDKERLQQSIVSWPTLDEKFCSAASPRTTLLCEALSSGPPSPLQPLRVTDSAAPSPTPSDVTFSPGPPGSIYDGSAYKQVELGSAAPSSPRRLESSLPVSPRRAEGTCTEEELQKAMYWASLSDADLRDLAERTLRGEVAPRLLRRLSRQDIVNLLSAYKTLITEPAASRRPRQGMGVHSEARSRRHTAAGPSTMERCRGARSGSRSTTPVHAMISTPEQGTRSLSRERTTSSTGRGTLDMSSRSCLWMGERAPRETLISRQQHLKEFADRADVGGSEVSQDGDIRPNTPRIHAIRKWLP